MPHIMGNITITFNFSYLQFEIYNEKSDKAILYLNTNPKKRFPEYRTFINYVS